MPEFCTTPVAFIVFNRPEVTARVFAAIHAARPPALYLIADGPRPNVSTDAERCAATRAAIAQIDWPCEVFRKFAPQNLGLRRNVTEGLDWVFAQAERAIVLEDDCLPNPTFFSFCDELLERYRDDEKISMISGTNLDAESNAPPGNESYYFSRFWHTWGWASWRRVWQSCDHEMKDWPRLRQTRWLQEKGLEGSARNFWRRYFDDSHARRRDSLQTWDVPVLFACWQKEMQAIIPRHNLVGNLGFGAEATHTKESASFAPTVVRPLPFPLQHPASQAVDEEADRHIQRNYFEGLTLRQRLYWKFRLPFPIWMVRRARRWLAA